MSDDPVRINTFLWETIDNFGLKKPLFPQVVADNWEKIFGVSIAENCKFVKIENHILSVKVLAADWLQELQRLKFQMVDKFNIYFDKKLIGEIEFIAPPYARRTKKNRKR